MNSVLYVVKSDDKWSIEAGRARLGPFPSRHRAAGVAVDAAIGAAASGHSCHVVVQLDQPAGWAKVWPPRARG